MCQAIFNVICLSSNGVIYGIIYDQEGVYITPTKNKTFYVF